MSHSLHQALVSLHVLSLRLYPHPFRAEFGEELRDTFASLLDDASEGGSHALLHICWREACHYPFSVTSAYRHTFGQRWRKASQQDVSKIRWMTRALSLFVLWFLVTIIQQGIVRYEPRFVPFIMMSAVTSVCLSLAWWREHLGGWLTIHASLSMIIALFLVALSLQGTAYDYLLRYFSMYLLYIVPSLITGVLFMSVSRAGRQPRSLA